MTPTAPVRPSHLSLPPGPHGVVERVRIGYRLVRDAPKLCCELEAEYPELAWIPMAKGAPFPGICFVFNPELARRVLVDDARSYRLNDFVRRLRILTGEGLLTSEGAPWSRQRRLIQPAFDHESLRALVPLMSGEIEATIDRWARGPQGGAVDLEREMARMSLNLMARALFSEDLGDEAATIAEATEIALAEVFARTMAPFSLPSFVPTPGNLRLSRATKQVDAAVLRIIGARRAASTRPPDLLTRWMEAEDPHTRERMTDPELRDAAITMFVAGHETSKASLSWALYLLAQRPDVQEKLRAEACAVLGERAPTFEDLRQLRYARRVFYETLRLYPQPWLLTRTADEDRMLGGFEVPRGAFVAIATYAIHRSARYWADSDRFDPGRFVGDSLPPSFIPFGLGPRRCVGEQFGIVESLLALAMFARRFSFSLVPGHPAIQAVGEVSLHPKDTIHICPRLRQ
jgi:cytochrome P450